MKQSVGSGRTDQAFAAILAKERAEARRRIAELEAELQRTHSAAKQERERLVLERKAAVQEGDDLARALQRGERL